MGLTLPGQLTEPLGWIGLTWPEADEELLYEAGQQWLAFASTLRSVAEPANVAAGEIWGRNEGESIDAFHGWWTAVDGPQQRLGEDAIAAEIDQIQTILKDLLEQAKRLLRKVPTGKRPRTGRLVLPLGRPHQPRGTRRQRRPAAHNGNRRPVRPACRSRLPWCTGRGRGRCG